MLKDNAVEKQLDLVDRQKTSETGHLRRERNLRQFNAHSVEVPLIDSWSIIERVFDEDNEDKVGSTVRDEDDNDDDANDGRRPGRPLTASCCGALVSSTQPSRVTEAQPLVTEGKMPAVLSSTRAVLPKPSSTYAAATTAANSAAYDMGMSSVASEASPSTTNRSAVDRLLLQL